MYMIHTRSLFGSFGKCFLLRKQSQVSMNSFLPCSPINETAFEDVTFPIRSWNQLSDLCCGTTVGVDVFSLKNVNFDRCTRTGVFMDMEEEFGNKALLFRFGKLFKQHVRSAQRPNFVKSSQIMFNDIYALAEYSVYNN